MFRIYSERPVQTVNARAVLAVIISQPAREFVYVFSRGKLSAQIADATPGRCDALAVIWRLVIQHQRQQILVFVEVRFACPEQLHEYCQIALREFHQCGVRQNLTPLARHRKRVIVHHKNVREPLLPHIARKPEFCRKGSELSRELSCGAHHALIPVGIK